MSLTALLAAGVALCAAQHTQPAAPTWVWLAPSHTAGLAVPRLNKTLVALSYQHPVPRDWEPIAVRPDIPKFFVKGHDHDIAHLQRAYGRDLVRVPGTREFYLVATDEGEVGKAHACGSAMLTPFPLGDGTAEASGVPPKGKERVPHAYATRPALKEAAMRRVTVAVLEDLLQRLSGAAKITVNGSEPFVLPTRYSYGEWNDKAARWIGAWLEEHAGCKVRYDHFKVGWKETRNVVCVKLGEEDPEKVVVLGAHFDSISSANGGVSSKFAPGAIDNGSGTANVMGVAAALKDFKFKHTVHYVLFSGEEQGLHGSKHYVKEVLERKAQESIVAALIMDMTGYSNKHYGVIVEGTRDKAIKELSRNAELNRAFVVDHFKSQLTVEPHDDSFGSDHVPFQTAGIPAVLLIERDDTVYPGYHKTTDQCSYANYGQMRDIARVILGQVMDHAGADANSNDVL